MSLLSEVNAINDQKFLEKLMQQAGTQIIKRHDVDMLTMGIQKNKMMEMCLLGGYKFSLPDSVSDMYEAIVLENTLHLFTKDFWSET